MAFLKRLILLLCTFFPSAMRVAVWRLLGFRIGYGCRVAMLSIVVADEIAFGPGVIIETLTLIYRPTRLVIGERSRIASFVRIIGYGTVDLGTQTFIGLASLIDTTGGFELGDRSHIAPRNLCYSHGSSHIIFNARFPHRTGPIRVGRDSVIGMGCIIYPRITIGDGVFVLPGTVVYRDIADHTAVLPGPEAYRLVPARAIQLNVSHAVQRTALDAILARLGQDSPHSQLDDSHDAVWVLQLPRHRAVYLLRDKTAAIDQRPLPTSSSVIWTLHRVAGLPAVPQFCFTELTVFGGWTPFAERLAAYLARSCGVHFVYASRTRPG